MRKALNFVSAVRFFAQRGARFRLRMRPKFRLKRFAVDKKGCGFECIEQSLDHASRLTFEESRPTHEEPAEAYRLVNELLEIANDLVGILIVGGGISGVLRAMRQTPEKRRKGIKLICRDIGPETRKGLSEGLIAAALCHPLGATSELLAQTIIDVAGQHASTATLQTTIPFEIVTPENV